MVSQSWRSLYPFKGRRLDLGGHAMHYLDEGQGETVLMVHGNPTWSFYFRELVKSLSPTHRCIVPDHIGMGLSDRPDEGRYRYTLASRVADLEKLMVYVVANAALGQPLTVDDPVVRGFLKLARVEDPRRALLELVANIRHQHSPRVVACPKCGAGVRDVIGVTDERCQFCGATLSTND
jgi:hypothetical protein